MSRTDSPHRFSLPLAGDVCLVSGRPPDLPHDEECPVPEHEAMLAGDELATAVHDPDQCHLCLATREVRCGCRCGRCCETLIIEATAFDARREPRIKERGQILTEGGLVAPEDADWLLNGAGGPCVFFRRDGDDRGVCEIYETRPLVCRHFNCDASELARDVRTVTPCSNRKKGQTMSANERQNHSLFRMGLILITPGVQDCIGREEILTALGRHAAGDWGEVDASDHSANDRAVREGDRLLSCYRATEGTKYYVVTEADRSATTVLTAEEY